MITNSSKQTIPHPISPEQAQEIRERLVSLMKDSGDESVTLWSPMVMSMMNLMTDRRTSTARILALKLSGIDKASPAMYYASVRQLIEHPNSKLPRGIERRVKQAKLKKPLITYEAPIEVAL